MKKAFFEKGTRAIEVVEALDETLWVKELKEVGNPPAYDMRFSWKTINSSFEPGTYNRKKEALLKEGYKVTKEEEITEKELLIKFLVNFGKEEGRFYALAGYPRLIAIYDTLTNTLWHNKDYTVYGIIAWVIRNF